MDFAEDTSLNLRVSAREVQERPENEWRVPFKCIECGESVFFTKEHPRRTATVSIRPHFSHNTVDRDNICDQARIRISEPESEEHLRMKDWFSGFFPEGIRHYEYRGIPNVRPDFIIRIYPESNINWPNSETLANWQFIAVEIQHSPITRETVTQRNQIYSRHQIIVCWIFDSGTFTEAEVRQLVGGWAILASFDGSPRVRLLFPDGTSQDIEMSLRDFLEYVLVQHQTGNEEPTISTTVLEEPSEIEVEEGIVEDEVEDVNTNPVVEETPIPAVYSVLPIGLKDLPLDVLQDARKNPDIDVVVTGRLNQAINPTRYTISVSLVSFMDSRALRADGAKIARHFLSPSPIEWDVPRAWIDDYDPTQIKCKATLIACRVQKTDGAALLDELERLVSLKGR